MTLETFLLGWDKVIGEPQAIGNSVGAIFCEVVLHMARLCHVEKAVQSICWPASHVHRS